MKKILLFTFLSIIIGCSENDILKDNNFQNEHLGSSKLNIYIENSASTRSGASYIENDSIINLENGDSIYVFNTRNKLITKFYYNLSEGCFKGEIPYTDNDGLSLLYPANFQADNEFVHLKSLPQTGVKDSFVPSEYYWGFGKTTSSSNKLGIKLFNLMARCNLVFVDKDKYPLSIGKIIVKVKKGGLYYDRVLNLSTGSLEKGNVSNDSIQIVALKESDLDRGMVALSLFPTSAMLSFEIEDNKGNTYVADIPQKIWNENSQTLDTVLCTEISQKQEYVEVCGVKWALGNLQYNKYRQGDKGFYSHWLIADRQYEYFNTNYGNVSDSAYYDVERQDHFNWGVLDQRALTIDQRGRLKNIEKIDIAAQMYTWLPYGFMYPSTQTTNFEEAELGDLCYWASKGKYRLPNREEMYSLYAKASCAFGFAVTDDGKLVRGALFYTPKGEREIVTVRRNFTKEELKTGLFLPGAGFRQCGEGVILRTGQGFYWNSHQEYEDNGLWSLRYINTVLYWSKDGSHYGRSMRPVLCE